VPYNMSRKYKFRNLKGVYFVSFATVYWIDVMVRDAYFSCIAESLSYCRKQIFTYCIMPSHFHMIFRDRGHYPGKLLKEFKTFTSKELQKIDDEVRATSSRQHRFKITLVVTLTLLTLLLAYLRNFTGSHFITPKADTYIYLF